VSQAGQQLAQQLAWLVLRDAGVTKAAAGGSLAADVIAARLLPWTDDYVRVKTANRQHDRNWQAVRKEVKATRKVLESLVPGGSPNSYRTPAEIDRQQTELARAERDRGHRLEQFDPGDGTWRAPLKANGHDHNLPAQRRQAPPEGHPG
jgi:hypothetical protein